MEYGGYLPLELSGGTEYHKAAEGRIKRFNSGRAAILDAIRAIDPDTIWIPHYICPTVPDMLSAYGYSYCQYWLNEDFTIQNGEDLLIGKRDCLLLVNYFGLNTDSVQLTARKFASKAAVIIDNTQAFFAPPMEGENLYHVYSCRKFVGVPDGGYLLGSGLSGIAYPQDCSSDRAAFLLTSLEHGTNYAYLESKKNEEYLAHPLAMSLLTRKILESTDYERIRESRRNNFLILNEELSSYNELKQELSGQVPYCYPLLCRKKVRDELIREKVYLPVLWKELITEEYRGTREWDWSEYLLPVPLDQRYSENEIRTMAEIIRKRIN